MVSATEVVLDEGLKYRITTIIDCGGFYFSPTLHYLTEVFLVNVDESCKRLYKERHSKDPKQALERHQEIVGLVLDGKITR